MNTKWDEENIEKLLMQAPKIQDHRSKEEVFAKLQAAGAFEEPQPVIQRKRRSYKRITSFVAAAAITCAIGIPMFLTMNGEEAEKVSNVAIQNMDDKANENANDSANDSASYSAKTNEEAAVTPFSTPNDTAAARAMAPIDSTAIYEDTVGEGEVFTVSLAGDNDVSIPSAIVIPKEKLVEDFGKEKPSQVEMYNLYAPKLNEEEFGFEDYHPLEGQITENGQELVIALEHPENYPTKKNLKALKETFPQYGEVLLEQDANTSETADKAELAAIPLNQNYSYYLFTQQDKKYYVQQPDVTYESVDEAILGMVGHSTEQYESAIIEGISFTVTVADNVHVKFNETLDLEALDYVRAKQMLEAIMLTAAEFQQQVVFENIKQATWDHYDFTNPMPIPVAPNELPIEMLQ
ncbi:hypothetical protein [Bacillus ndiopicus]|uniref:hypothetical protein n=1 Tax=Bacillus ndiopicus TaxID=1347368 RepID=UPI0005A7D9F5|nr:hypothetical protein [Bacillus ndiopicus]